MLRYGCTRLEIGVQSVYEDVARDTNRCGRSVHVGGTRGGEAERPPVAVLSVGNSNRGHTVKAVCESFELAKDAGYKVVAHMMPDLPNVGLERDIEQFIVLRPTRAPKRHSRFANARANAGPEPCHHAQELFANPAFRPDGLKLYPTLVIRGTGAWVPRAARLSGCTIADHPAHARSCGRAVRTRSVRTVALGPVQELPARGLGRSSGQDPRASAAVDTRLSRPAVRALRRRCRSFVVATTHTIFKSFLPWWTVLGTFPCRW